jgi:hypothetical protein
MVRITAKNFISTNATPLKSTSCVRCKNSLQFHEANAACTGADPVGTGKYPSATAAVGFFKRGLGISARVHRHEKVRLFVWAKPYLI